MKAARLVLYSAILNVIAAHAAVITDPGQGAISFPGSNGFSGITWAGGSTYYLVPDNQLAFYPLTLATDPTTGWLSGPSLGAAIAVTTGVSDFEGIAYLPGSSNVLISAESDSSIRNYSLTGGVSVLTVGVPTIYQSPNFRTNLSLESLSYSSVGQTLWTANEGALSSDGGVSTTNAGTLVRLQRFDNAFNPTGQYAYLTDPISGDGPYTSSEQSGVSDLVALPDGGLLVLEREFGGTNIPDFRIRIYEVSLTGATDVSGLSTLTNGGFTSAGKSLLWEGNFSSNNFEGIALGPQLTNGDYSLILVSDSGGGAEQSVYALRISAIPEANIPLLILCGGVVFLCVKRQRTEVTGDHSGQQAEG